MEPAVIIAIAVFAPTALALLALRFGADTRPALQSPEQIQADLGITWYGTPTTEPRAPKIVLRRSAARQHPYPTLHLLDSARGEEAATFATDPNAETLERHARELADEYWPDHVWLTGLVSPTQLAAVTGPLDAERERRLDAIRLLVATEPATTGERVHQA